MSELGWGRFNGSAETRTENCNYFIQCGKAHSVNYMYNLSSSNSRFILQRQVLTSPLNVELISLNMYAPFNQSKRETYALWKYWKYAIRALYFFIKLSNNSWENSNFLMDEPAGLLESSERFYRVQNLVSQLYESNILPDLLQNTGAFDSIHIHRQINVYYNSSFKA